MQPKFVIYHMPIVYYTLYIWCQFRWISQTNILHQINCNASLCIWVYYLYMDFGQFWLIFYKKKYTLIYYFNTTTILGKCLSFDRFYGNDNCFSEAFCYASLHVPAVEQQQIYFSPKTKNYKLFYYLTMDKIFWIWLERYV